MFFSYTSKSFDDQVDVSLFVCLFVFSGVIRVRELKNVLIIDLKLEFPHNDHVVCFQQYQKYNRDKNVIKDRVITLVNTVDAVSYLWSFTLAFLLLNHFFNHLLSEGKEKSA